MENGDGDIVSISRLDLLDRDLDQTRIEVAVNKTKIEAMDDKVNKIDERTESINKHIDELGDKLQELKNNDFLKLTTDFDIKKLFVFALALLSIMVGGDFISTSILPGNPNKNEIQEAIKELMN